MRLPAVDLNAVCLLLSTAVEVPVADSLVTWALELFPVTILDV